MTDKCIILETCNPQMTLHLAQSGGKYLSSHFSTAVRNPTRRQWKEKYRAPNTSATACPNLDKVIKGRLSSVTKSHDKQLARLQLLTWAHSPTFWRRLSALDAAQTALKLLGNASANLKRERRKNAILSMNTRLVDMAEDDAIYKTAAPSFFGEGFCKKAKERGEELRCLNQATSSRSTNPPGP